MKAIIKFTFIFNTVFSLIASAEEPKRGTLPDGRPFRTDVQGTQIVDYIADLENSVEYLKERVSSLETELEMSKDALARFEERGCRGGAPGSALPPKPKLLEKTLLESDRSTINPPALKAELPRGDSFSLDTPRASVKREQRRILPKEDPISLYRSAVLKQIGEVNSLLSKRSELYEEYLSDKTGRAITFKLANPVSKTGRSVSDISQIVRAAKSQRQLVGLIGELEQIKKLVREDTELIERLS